MPTPSSMTGPRSWRFESGSQYVEMINTDFSVLYSADAGDGQPMMKITLRKVWEHSDFTQYAMDRAKYMEDRLSVLATSDLVNHLGTLTVDGVAVIMPMRFKGISLEESGAPNELFVYSVEFERAVPGAQLYRHMLFGTDLLSAECQNFFVTFGNDDRTSFTEIFNAAPVRMENGPGLKSLTVNGILQQVLGDSPKARQLNSEWAAGNLIWQKKGLSALLKMDGREVGICHLKDVVIKATVPNGIYFELQFVTGYGVA